MIGACSELPSDWVAAEHSVHKHLYDHYCYIVIYYIMLNYDNVIVV